MAGRLAWCCWLLVAAGGCWDEERIGGVFTDDQLAALRDQFALPDPVIGCPDGIPRRCDLAARWGQELFFDATMSSTGTVSCATCHDPKAWFVDPRNDNAVSLGVKSWTGRNTLSLVNAGLKPPGTFTWVGLASPSDVLLQVTWPKAMGMEPSVVGEKILASPRYRGLYTTVFGAVPPDTAEVAANTALVLDAYVRKLISLDAPFDRFMGGDRTAMSEPAVRGFGVFAGRGMCIECHRGPLFSDNAFHVTGVEQTSVHAPALDGGRDNTGAFFTATLRNIEHTGPYMHEGSLGSLTEVVDFYHWGGGVTDYPKDPLMEQLELDGDDSADLVAFLRALSGAPIANELQVAPAPKQCGDTSSDEQNCGSCDASCQANELCVGGACKGNSCQTTGGNPGLLCGPSGCTDIFNDRMNCGGCGQRCPAGQNCMAGSCI